MFMIHLFWMIHLKSTCHIGFSSLFILQCLFGCIFYASHMSGIYWYSCYFSYCSRYIFGLIIASTTHAFFMQWYRYYKVDSIEEIRTNKFSCSFLCQLISNHGLICIFHLVHYESYRVIFLVIQECCSSFKARYFSKYLFHAICAQDSMFCAGQFVNAISTKQLLITLI